MKTLSIIFLTLVAVCSAFAQVETLTNESVIEMSKAGLSKNIIVTKISESDADFDTSTAALIKLKNAGVDDEIIKLMMDIASSVRSSYSTSDQMLPEKASEITITYTPRQQSAEELPEPKQAVINAKSIALLKSSTHPSRQNLEKALLKNEDFKKLDLTILRYKEEADIYVEIGRVPLSLITHRYVYRIFDRKSGIVIASGETTSWGSLAENLARHISRSLNEIANKS